MNVWRTPRVYRFCLIPCQSFFGRLKVRMLLRPYPTERKRYLG